MVIHLTRALRDKRCGRMRRMRKRLHAGTRLVQTGFACSGGGGSGSSTQPRWQRRQKQHCHHQHRHYEHPHAAAAGPASGVTWAVLFCCECDPPQMSTLLPSGMSAWLGYLSRGLVRHEELSRAHASLGIRGSRQACRVRKLGAGGGPRRLVSTAHVAAGSPLTTAPPPASWKGLATDPRSSCRRGPR